MKILTSMQQRAWAGAFAAAIAVAGLSLGAPDAALAKAKPAATAQDGGWVTAWAAGMRGPSLENHPRDGGFYKDTSLREIIPLNTGARTVRIEFSNRRGTRPLLIASAYAGVQETDAAVSGNTRITFSGRDSISIEPGSVWMSDPVTVDVAEGRNLAVSMYLAWHSADISRGTSGAMTYIATGDKAAGAQGEGFALTGGEDGSFFVSGVDVKAPGLRHTIAAIGDSLTAGGRTSWPGVMAQELRKSHPDYSVFNVAIGGNRLTKNSACLGMAGLTRLNDDVLSRPNVSVIVAMWTNDIIMNGNTYERLDGPKFPYDCIGARGTSADDIIAGYRQLIARAHARGIKVILGTTTPFGESPTFEPLHEEIRLKVNQWVMTSGEPDGFVDFSAPLANTSTPPGIRAEMDGPDHLHFNDVAKAAMGHSAAQAVSGLIRGK